jgi:hypothetical protein
VTALAPARTVNGPGELRILFITEYAMYPATTGGRQRTDLLVRALSQVGGVDIFWINGDEPVTDPEQLRVINERYHPIARVDPQDPADTGLWKLLHGINAPLANRVVNFVRPADRYLAVRSRVRDDLRRICDLSDYDVIVGRYAHSLARTDVLGSRPCIVDIDDFDSSMVQTRLMQGRQSALHANMDRRSLPELLKRESRIVAACDGAWVATANDLEKAGAGAAAVLPNIPYVPEGAIEPVDVPMPDNDSRILMTVGSLRHVPNVQGIDAFLRGPWGPILARVPDAQFHIVGSGLQAADRERWQELPGVRVVGFIDDLAGAYASCAATVCNVPWGAGSNIKVVESLAYARPALVSEMALRGWDNVFTGEDGLCAARSAGEMVECAVRLLLHPALRRRMGRRGRELARAHFSLASFTAVVASTVRGAIERSGERR